MASKFNFGKRLRVIGHEYRKTDHGPHWDGILVKTVLCQKGGILDPKWGLLKFKTLFVCNSRHMKIESWCRCQHDCFARKYRLVWNDLSLLCRQLTLAWFNKRYFILTKPVKIFECVWTGEPDSGKTVAIAFLVITYSRKSSDKKGSWMFLACITSWPWKP